MLSTAALAALLLVELFSLVELLLLPVPALPALVVPLLLTTTVAPARTTGNGMVQ